MYLREVQLENFKSFGKKVRIPFLPGFTAITGPNGSGKSNISDAILFVLGPKSPKMIRAGRLTDLIYKGKKDVNYCKVSLVLEDENEEIVLTRKVKRAPLPDNPDNYYSYFYINNKAASLSDFVHILSSSNISANSIVQQGDVTAIVEMGDVPRRRILDDIAGVSEFDRDIEKSEKEKAEVEKNLEYIGIILKEIRSQLNKLKNERDGAIEYKKLDEELKKAKAMLSYKKRTEVEREIGEIEKQINSYQKERERLESEIKNLRDAYRKKQIELQNIEEKIAGLGGAEVEEIKEKTNAAREEMIKAKEKINYFTQEIVEGKEERKELEANLSRLKKEIKNYSKRIDELEKELTDKTKSIKSREAELEKIRQSITHSDKRAMDITRKLAEIKKRYEKERSALHELELKRDRLMQQVDSLGITISELEENKNTYEFELKDIKWQISEIGKSEREKRRGKERLEQELFQKKKEEAEISAALQKLDREVIHLQRELSRLKAKEDASSYTRATREILKARDEGKIRGIHGSISELGEVDEKYRRALGVAAGRRAEAIVVDNERVATECIKYLKKNDYGRTTFLPLNKMIVGKPRGKALMTVKENGSLGFALDLVKFDEIYRPAFWYVFGDTIVMENLEVARSVMGGVRLVTLDGEIIETSGAMIGGSMPKVTSFGDADKRMVGEIGKKLMDVTHQQELLSEKLIEVREQIAAVGKKLREFSDEVDDRIGRLEIRKKEFEGKLEVILKELGKKKEEHEKLQREIEQIGNEIQSKASLIEEMEKEREQAEARLKEISKKEVTSRIEELRREIDELKEKERNISSEIKTLSKEMEIVVEREKEVRGRIDEIERKEKEYSSEIKELQKIYSENKDKMEALMEVERSMLGKMKGLTKERDELYKESVEIENKIDSFSTKMETSLDLISRAKSRLPTLEQTLAEMMLETENYEFEGEEIPPIEELKARIKEIENRMERLQPVNMRALEEYERQDERRRKFEEDVHRLKEQRRNLIKLVEEIEKKKKDAFYAVYEAVKENFELIYTELLGGGEAELVLENKENPFEGGLIIKARPKGKRIMRLNALSGGEKSMASLAFIFAIQAYDPSPFYILDEVDMFLDGKNAEKVADMIKERSRNTQFIAISLRRVTLNKADHIYGVTMQEGVSTIVGNVNLSQVEEIVEVK